MKISFRLLSLLVLFVAITAPLAKAGDVAAAKIVGTWKGNGFETPGAVKITFQPNGNFDLEFEDKDGPIRTHGSYTTDASQTPWKLVITLTPDDKTITVRTLMSLVSDNQLLIQRNEPEAALPQRFTKDSVILDKVN